MKTIKPLIISIFIFIIGCSPYKIYNKYEDLKTNNFIEFYLPINILKIDIEIEKTEINHLLSRNIDGIIIAPCGEEGEHLMKIKKKRIAHNLC